MTSDYSQLMKPWYEQLEAQKPPSQSAPTRLSEAEELEVAEARQRATSNLHLALVGRILAQSPEFFEQLIVDVMLAMGYGARRRDLARRLGRKGDGGVDGVVKQDELGLLSSFCRPSATSWGRQFRLPTSGTSPGPLRRIMRARVCSSPPASSPRQGGILLRCCRGASC